MRRFLQAAFGLAFAAIVLPAAPAQATVPVGAVLTRYAGTGVDGAPTPGPATNSMLNQPYQLALGADGTLYIADANNKRVEKIAPDGTLSTIAGTGGTGLMVPGLATNSPLAGPAGIAVDADGNVYVAAMDAQQVGKIDTNGQLTVIAGDGTRNTPIPGTATSSPLKDPVALAVNAAGDVFIADSGNHTIDKVSGGVLSIFAGTGTLGAPTVGPATNSDLDAEMLAIDASGNLYNADSNGNVVEKITPGGQLSFAMGDGIAGNPLNGSLSMARLDQPTGVTVSADGDLYVFNSGNYTVAEVHAGIVTIVAGNGSAGPTVYGGSAGLSPLEWLAGLAVDIDGTLFIANNYYSAIERVGVDEPMAPTDLSAVPGNHSVTLTFTPPARSGLSPVAGYEYSTDGGTTWHTLAATGSGATRTATLTGLANGTGYTFTIRAQNSTNAGLASATATATPSTSVPLPVTGSPVALVGAAGAILLIAGVGLTRLGRAWRRY